MLDGVLSEGYGIMPKKIITAKINPQAKLLWALMSSYSASSGYCSCSNDTLAKIMKVTPRYITICRNVLEKNGFICIERREGYTSKVIMPVGVNHSSGGDEQMNTGGVNHSSSNKVNRLSKKESINNINYQNTRKIREMKDGLRTKLSMR